MIIKTKDFVLRPLKISDAKGYFEVNQDAETQRNLTSYPKNLEEAKKDIENDLKEDKEKGSEHFTILVNGVYAGNVILQYQDFDKKSRDGRVHLLIHPKFRGKGLGTRALEEAINYGFRKKFDRIYAQCKAINKGIIKINEKLGFKKVKTYVNESGIKKILWVKLKN